MSAFAAEGRFGEIPAKRAGIRCRAQAKGCLSPQCSSNRRARIPAASHTWPGEDVRRRHRSGEDLKAVEVCNVTSIVDRVTLYRSQLSQQGPHYTGLVSAPLTSAAP